jgi:hypothetical protein
MWLIGIVLLCLLVLDLVLKLPPTKRRGSTQFKTNGGVNGDVAPEGHTGNQKMQGGGDRRRRSMPGF